MQQALMNCSGSGLGLVLVDSGGPDFNSGVERGRPSLEAAPGGRTPFRHIRLGPPRWSLFSCEERLTVGEGVGTASFHRPRHSRFRIQSLKSHQGGGEKRMRNAFQISVNIYWKKVIDRKSNVAHYDDMLSRIYLNNMID